ncbi:hypothetical protein N7491_004883 [Penicillium cf. griseofulvum]|uniref:Uncharacterized protein n=1 Tax=Penicillium cf. griseofulvum TaxID=2972120 RepID=A0A9W9J0U5_9EURO|nr:hypothetical protein N7472_007577 [Penicillium cf. griseofulvum]KAJ5434288.1 hypothetical protein N7491_004883 [Penicillium cf. griseofulvum]KAJ5452119.1 hypothetical protein N7445_000302 [Penicillium cf. griseofulvum]
MTRLTTIFITLCALYLPLISAWTFTWRDDNNKPIVEKGTSAQNCREIDHAKGKNFEFDPEDDHVLIAMYESPKCTGDTAETSEDDFAKASEVRLRGYRVIDLGPNMTTSDKLTPFPGAEWFKASPNSPIVTAMGKRLVAEGCGKYSVGPGPLWSEVDRKSYQCWQEKLGFTGDDADGWPGQVTWDKLEVPLTTDKDGGKSSTTKTPSSTSTGTGTPTPTPTSTNTDTGTPTPTPTSTLAPDTYTSSGSSLGGGAIAGIVIGVVAGLGLVGAIAFFLRRRSRRSAPASGAEEPRVDPEGGSGVAVGGSINSPMEKLPAEAEAIPAKNQQQFAVELPGDTTPVELSDRKVFELGDSRK